MAAPWAWARCGTAETAARAAAPFSTSRRLGGIDVMVCSSLAAPGGNAGRADGRESTTRPKVDQPWGAGLPGDGAFAGERNRLPSPREESHDPRALQGSREGPRARLGGGAAPHGDGDLREARRDAGGCRGGGRRADHDGSPRRGDARRV